MTDESKLIAAAKAGSADAFCGLAELYRERLLRFLLTRCASFADAEDVLQDTLIAAFRYIHSYDSRWRFSTWLYRIASNAINSHLRKTGRRQRLLKNLDKPAPVTSTADHESEADKLILLKAIMLTLKPRYQTIITLRFFENLKLTDIAEVVGCSPGTARSSLARAIAQLRKKLKGAGMLGFEGGDCHD